jgi:hypothetical protein
MKTIKVIFTSPNTFKLGSEGIKLWQGFTSYSHVGIELDTDIIFHAAYGKVHFQEKNEFLKHNLIKESVSIVLPDELYYLMIEKMKDYEGIVYGYDELIKIVFSDIIWNITGIRPNIGNGKGFICSELVGALLTYLIGAKFHKPLNLLTPKDIRNYLREKQYE